MKVSVYGSGYVGLVVAACFAEVGNEVVCTDINAHKIEKLNKGIIPIYEPGLEEIIRKAREMGYLRFTTDVAATVRHGECQFIAVGTPPDPEGKADLKYVLAVAESIAQYCNDYTIIINKSTVPIGTADKVRETLARGFKARNVDVLYDVVSNPEFLKEGAALEDFRKPDRIVLGIDNSRAENKLKTLYAPFNHNESCLMIMDTRSAELTKYAANAMLATKISFMNEMANLAEKVGADIEKVRKGIGADPRIGYHFTYPGCGYGGSCFGKDIQALIHTAQYYQSQTEIVQAVESVNAKQKRRVFEKIEQHYKGKLAGKVFAVWGLAFKPETDDMRDAPSLVVIDELLNQGATIQAFDPQSMNEARKMLGPRKDLIFGQSPEEVIEGANALVILTEWRLFRSPDFRLLKQSLLEPIIFDGRNIYDPILLDKMGFKYYGIGRGLRKN
jgi:UDPglucose 6-dehydrogenase